MVAEPKLMKMYTLELDNTYIQTLGLNETYMEFIRYFAIIDLNRNAALAPGTTYLGSSIFFYKVAKNWRNSKY